MSDPTCGPLVFSHPRSGTHFLGCALYLNFDLESASVAIDREYFRRDQPVFVAADQASDEVPWGSLVAHLEVHCFRENVDPGVSQRLYVWRDCHDVLASLYGWKMLRNHRDSPLDEERSFARFLREPLGWAESVHNPAERSLNPLEHWAYHTSGWLASGDCCVRYEELIEDYDGTLARIQQAFGLRRKAGASGAFLPVERRVGYNPGQGGSARRAELYSDEDLAWVRSELRRLARWYPSAARVLGVEAPSADEPHEVPRFLARRAEAEREAETYAARAELQATCAERDQLRQQRNEFHRERDAYRQRYHRTLARLEQVEREGQEGRLALGRFVRRVHASMERSFELAPSELELEPPEDDPSPLAGATE